MMTQRYGTGKGGIRGCMTAGIPSVLVVAGAAFAAPPLDPIPAPHYSFDVGSPSITSGVIEACGILRLAFPAPETALCGMTLGLMDAADDIDALSGRHDGYLEGTQFSLMFSIDRDTVGLADPDESLVEWGIPYNAKDQSSRGHAAGDQFLSTERFTIHGQVPPLVGVPRNNNFLARNNFDEGGTDFAALPATHAHSIGLEGLPQDRLDAMGWLHADEAGRISQAFFSLTADAPSLATMPGPASGASIFVAEVVEPVIGACCLPDETCTVLEEAECSIVAGIWQGPGSTCDACAPVEPTGGCCLPDGTCLVATVLECGDVGGLWQGDGSNCDDCASFLTGACCFPFGGCVQLANWFCASAGGQFIENADCSACIPELAGICCMIDDCELRSRDSCEASGGIWLGQNVTCDLCPALGADGACCFPGDECVQTADLLCQVNGGIWLGAESDCESCPATLVAPGACCFADGGCDVLPEAECLAETGVWWGPQTTCDVCPDDSSSTTGACCLLDACDQLDAVVCTLVGGVWLGPDVDCDSCGTDAPCCLPDEQCELMSASDCHFAGGTWRPEGTCSDCMPTEPMVVRLFASPADLGLLMQDDIDALVVFDYNGDAVFNGEDRVVFSLAPGSPSLGLLPGVSAAGAADLFVVRHAGIPTVLAQATALGLGHVSDNIDALEIHTTTSRISMNARYGIRVNEDED